MPCISCSDIHKIDPWDERSKLSDPQEDPQEDPLSELLDDPQENEILPPDMPCAHPMRPRNVHHSLMTAESEDEERPLPKKHVHNSKLDNQGKNAEADPQPRPTKMAQVEPKDLSQGPAKGQASNV